MPVTRYAARSTAPCQAGADGPGPRRLLTVLVGLTVLVMGADVARPSLTEPLRTGAAAALGPVQRAMSPGPSAEVEEVTRERDALRAEVQAGRRAVREARALTALLDPTSGSGQERVPARVVGFSSTSTPVAARTVTLDVGSRDGIREGLTVVSADGLVGRVVRAAPWTCDVLVVGGPDVTVAVRVGESGALGSVSARHPVALPGRAPGELTLTMLGQAPVLAGQEVLTLGSPGRTPYVPGVPVGTVTAVDPEGGQLGRTAVVVPHVDVETLDVVAVVVPRPREDARSPVPEQDGDRP